MRGQRGAGTGEPGLRTGTGDQGRPPSENGTPHTGKTSGPPPGPEDLCVEDEPNRRHAQLHGLLATLRHRKLCGALWPNATAQTCRLSANTYLVPEVRDAYGERASEECREVSGSGGAESEERVMVG